MTTPNKLDHSNNKQELNSLSEVPQEELKNKVHSGLSKNEPVINQEKFLEALWLVHDEKRMQELDHKMTEELEAGLYCLNCCSIKLIELLKAFCWTELELLTLAQLDESYRHITSDIARILNYNEPIKEYIKRRGYYDELLSLTKLFPDVLTNSSLRITNWEEAMDAAHRFSVIVSKICYVETYTPPTDDSFTSRLGEMNKYISKHWEMRELRTDKKTINKVKKTKPIDGDINSKLKKLGARNIATLCAKNTSQVIDATTPIAKEADKETKNELSAINEKIIETLVPYLEFYPKERALKTANNEIILPAGSYELYIAQELFSKPIDIRTTDEELREVLTSKRGQEPKSPSAVADTVIRINEKGKEKLGIDEIIKSENSTYWIDPSLRNIKPTQPSQI